MTPPRTWVLLGDKTGDNNQLLALVERLGWPFETRPLRYNLRRAIPSRFLGATLTTLLPASRQLLAPPWPDLVLAVGRRSAPVARWIAKRNGGETKLVHVGNPRLDPSLFDLVLTTAQYPVSNRANVVTLPFAMGRPLKTITPSEAERALFVALPRPHLLAAIGGPTKYWDLAAASVEAAIDRLAARADRSNGTLLVAGSRRTPYEIIDRVRARLADSRHLLVEGDMPRFALMLRDADELFVTADSVSMLSEAIQTGKPVGMIPVGLSTRGARVLGKSADAERRRGSRRRDLRRVWRRLRDDGLVGTIDEPSTGQIECDSVEIAAAAVRALIAGNEKQDSAPLAS